MRRIPDRETVKKARNLLADLSDDQRAALHAVKRVMPFGGRLGETLTIPEYHRDLLIMHALAAYRLGGDAVILTPLGRVAHDLVFGETG